MLLDGGIPDFEPGQEDYQDCLQMPQKLYGREAETGQLLAAFDRASAAGGRELLLIAGYSGTGKTALVHETHRFIAKKQGNFIEGKFDQLQHNVPYIAWIQAFSGFVNYLLMESETQLVQWQQIIRKTLGNNGKVLTDVIPNMELIIGPQADVPLLGAIEAQNRFNHVFLKFIEAIATEDHPLVVFLDDLQWIDTASLILLQTLITSIDVSHILVIGAYRDNEVDALHPLTITLEALRKEQSSIAMITLKGLAEQTINALIADALHDNPLRTLALTQLIHAKTGGNPFFTLQMLKSLVERQAIAFNADSRCWQWDMVALERMELTDNVVTLMAGKILTLGAITQYLLTLAACMGFQFDLSSLSIIAEQTADTVLNNLQPALHEGVIIPSNGIYRFAHDRIQQAAYSLIPDTDKKNLHLKIGRLLASQLSAVETGNRVFEIADHLNTGSALIVDQDEKNRLVMINLLAARKAKAANANASALEYSRQGLSLLEADCWETLYDSSFELYLVTADCEYMDGNLQTAEQLLDLLLAKAQGLAELATIHRRRIALQTTSGNLEKAIACGLEGIRLFGIELSNLPTRAEVDNAYAEIWQILGDRPIEDLINCPAMTDTKLQVIMDLLADIGTPAIFARQNLLHLSLAYMVRISIEQGITDASVWAFTWFGATLVQRDFGRHRDGYRFGKLAYDMMLSRNVVRYKAMVCLVFGDNTNFYANHFKTDRPYIHEAFNAAMENGAPIWACYSCNHIITNMLAVGDPLDTVWEESERRLEFIRRVKDPNIEKIILSQQRFIRNMRGLTRNFSTFGSDDFDQEEFEATIQGSQMRLMVCWYYILKLQARFIYGDIEEAIVAAEVAGALILSSGPDQQGADYDFFAALAKAAHWRMASAERQGEYLTAISAHLHLLHDWAEACPENFFNRYALVSAEFARISGRELEAEQYFQQAIQSAQQNGFVHNQAIANELASRFYRYRGLKIAADAHLFEACRCYALWGAAGKVLQLQRLYPNLVEPLQGRAEIELDVMTILRATHAISIEMELDRLLATMMRIIMENAGAQRGFLLQDQDDVWRIAAKNEMGASDTGIQLLAGLDEDDPVSMGIVRFTARTKERVVLEDAANQGKFVDDSYIKQHKTRSLLCTPLLSRNRMVGVLYLENNLTSGAFTPKRVQLLEILLSQAVISLENAGSYQALRKSEEKYRELILKIHAAVVVHEADTRILTSNLQAQRLLGLTEEQMAEKQAVDPQWHFYREDGSAMSLDEYPVNRVLTTKRSFRDAVMGIHRANNEEDVWVLVGADPVFDEQGELAQVIVTFMDITGLKHAELELEHHRYHLEELVAMRTQELSTARDAAEAANRAKSTFLSNMSHELRTPLNAILGFSNLMRRDPQATESQRNNLDIINRSGEHLLSLINDVLEMAKIEAGRLQLEDAPFDLGHVVNDVTSMMQARAAEKGLQLLVDQSSEFPRYIAGDEARVRQVLINLVGNALKFTQQGGVTIRLGTKNNARAHLLIEVEDSGSGIAPEDQKRIFDPFVQLNQPADNQGTGLGLSITRQFVELMKGSISLESTPGKGTLFRVEFPLRLAETTDINNPYNPEERDVLVLAPGQHEYRILIVEDQPENQCLLAKLMESAGLKFMIAENGKEAVEKFQTWRPHLIWMDRRMPVMDGLEATKIIRTLSGGKEVKIIAVTASAFAEQRAEILDAGMDDFIRKPYRASEIYECLSMQLGVQYEYANTQNSVIEPVVLTAEMLSVLPEEFRRDLENTLITLDSERIGLIVQRIAEHDQNLKKVLTRLADSYDYPAILKALRNQ